MDKFTVVKFSLLIFICSSKVYKNLQRPKKIQWEPKIGDEIGSWGISLQTSIFAGIALRRSQFRNFCTRKTWIWHRTRNKGYQTMHRSLSQDVNRGERLYNNSHRLLFPTQMQARLEMTIQFCKNKDR